MSESKCPYCNQNFEDIQWHMESRHLASEKAQLKVREIESLSVRAVRIIDSDDERFKKDVTVFIAKETGNLYTYRGQELRNIFSVDVLGVLIEENAEIHRLKKQIKILQDNFPTDILSMPTFKDGTGMPQRRTSDD